ncbi:hypothetical protein N9985_01955 [Gammaproteobacteria bacterium]|nr:hypothetical protein [Gammaproteobacteria bacterium]
MAGLFGNVSAEGGFDQSEINLVTQLINSGQTTIDEVSSTFGVPRDVVASVYAQNAPQAQEDNDFSGLLSTASKANNVINSGVQAVDALKTFNVLKNTPATAATAATTMEELAANNPMLIQNLSGSGSDGFQILTEAEKTAQMQQAADVFAGGLGSIVGAVSGKESTAETLGISALSALGLINPAAALAYRIFDAMDLFGGGGLKETPMAPEEALKYAGESRLATTLQSQGEGAGELILDAVEQARAANVEPEKIAEALNSSTNPVAGLINLTVGSNQMLSDADMAAAQEAAAADSTDTLGGSTSSLESDADLMGTVDTIGDSVVSGGSTAGSATDVINTDAEHPWLYEGNGVLRNVFTGEVETNESGTENLVVGETYSSGTPTEATTRSNDTTDSGNINVILTPNGSGDTTSTVIDAASNGPANTTVVDASGDVTGTGDVFNTATDTKNTGETLTTGTAVKPSTVVTKGDDGKDGVNGTDGLNGGDGKDGTDGKDGATGLLMMGMLSSPIANNIFKTEFESNYLRPEYVDRILRGKGMNNNGRNT